jgi:N-acetylmuramoyl-L-alanine amidase
MKIAVDIGHNCPYDGGAVGIGNENILNLEVGDKVIEKLRKSGHEVICVTPTDANSLGDSLKRRVEAANKFEAELYISIHFNAGGGRGTEVYAISEKGKAYAQTVVKEIAALGYVNRGVKDGKALYVLKNTKAPAILVECAFVDSSEDMSRLNTELIANAIVKGVVGELPEEYHGLMYRVHVQDIGWQDWRRLGEMAGTIGKSLRIEALEIKEV